MLLRVGSSEVFQFCYNRTFLLLLAHFKGHSLLQLSVILNNGDFSLVERIFHFFFFFFLSTHFEQGDKLDLFCLFRGSPAFDDPSLFPDLEVLEQKCFFFSKIILNMVYKKYLYPMYERKIRYPKKSHLFHSLN